ncbi:unnamed protein product [Heligmosomoides polygyrus]|uniref:Uncharacterized protein n=1 Tax=Heligmosomoides polygyrus TaxID=6339 RepID=A0A183GPM9_HELPZ|nr:unnamed protein product [Heligmosomoides polygyrus]
MLRRRFSPSVAEYEKQKLQPFPSTATTRCSVKMGVTLSKYGVRNEEAMRVRNTQGFAHHQRYGSISQTAVTALTIFLIPT